MFIIVVGISHRTIAAGLKRKVNGICSPLPDI